ncbi:MAG: cupin domain-containing protein [Planctomycetes bacterium]|nr:cupin domain-containing protein [Planctomycetota bacterium]MCB9869137.1 cupin domain-containing protein [Planctomycetota bacterium]MCB9889027.1 cupin domain-containing protein [Planctomycetota bacterium]
MPHATTLPLALVLATCIPATAQSSPGVRWFPAAAVPAAGAAAKPWLPLLDTTTLSLGRYRLKAGSRDGQTPHARDEVYFVISGKAQFTAGGDTRPVGVGDTIFVAAGMAHRFSAITADLDVLVFFSSARPATGGMAAGPRPTEQTPYPETSQRGNTRIFYWFGPSSAGQVSIDFGQPRWKAQYGAFLTKPSGRRWRFGQNFWTTLDTNMPLRIGGVDVPVGAHYLVLEHTAPDGLRLVLLSPTEIRKQRLDAYQAPSTRGGLSIPLVLDRAQRTAPRLDLELSIDRAQRDRGTLTVRFGPHRLTAPVEMKPQR